MHVFSFFLLARNRSRADKTETHVGSGAAGGGRAATDRSTRGAAGVAGDGKRKRKGGVSSGDHDGKAPKLVRSNNMSRDETIANFQAITGIENLNECVSILETHNWNLESAAAASLAQHDPFAHSAGPSMMSGVASGGAAASGGPTRRGPAAQARPQHQRHQRGF